MAGNSLIKYTIFSNADISQAETSNVVDCQFLDNVGIQINITSPGLDATGQFDVEVSADYAISLPSGTVTNPGNWGSIASPLINSGLPAVTILNVNQLPFAFIRLRYTPTSGSGTCTAYALGKAI